MMLRMWAAALAWSAAIAAGAATPRPPLTSVSHIAIYAADPAKSAAFYTHDLGAVRRPDPENAAAARYYFNPIQFVEVIPLPAGYSSINRMDHVGFNTADAEAMRRYLGASGVRVPPQVRTATDGSRWFEVTDPEGNRIQFVQPPAHPEPVARNALSDHIMHVGFIIHNRAREDAFYKGVLGFRPYWYGGMKEDHPTWISLQLPDGTDWLEYMIVGTPDTTGIPPTMKAADLGVLDHFSLGVANTRTAYTLLWNGGRLDGQSAVPKIGRDAKWQLNLLDPDGTRAEIMEFHAIGKPCCSPFTAKDPDQ